MHVAREAQYMLPDCESFSRKSPMFSSRHISAWHCDTCTYADIVYAGDCSLELELELLTNHGQLVL